MGAGPLTFSGFAGVGDLSEHFGQGMSVEEAAKSTHRTAESVKSHRVLPDLARTHGVEMPIPEFAAAVIDGGATVEDAAATLLSRIPKPEHYGA
jgi:glycerol-3-phosphate dehydrogenase (NAD(P)+)